MIEIAASHVVSNIYREVKVFITHGRTAPTGDNVESVCARVLVKPPHVAVVQSHELGDLGGPFRTIGSFPVVGNIG